MFNQFRRKSRTFYIDEDERFFRCWWLAIKVTNKVLENFLPSAISSWINDVRFQNHDRKAIVEIIGYTMSFTINRLFQDIKAIHGWSEKEYELNIGYQVCICKSFDQVFGIEDDSEESFCNLIDDYLDPEYEGGYEEFWGITYDDYPEPDDADDDVEVPEIESVEQVIEIMDEIEKEDKQQEKKEEQWRIENFNIEKYYVYRMSNKFNFNVAEADTRKMIDNLDAYRDIGNAYYDDAFFGLGLSSIKRRLKQIVNQ